MNAAPNPPSGPQARALWLTYLAFVGPMVLANVLQSLSGTVNGIYIGQMLGTRELAAVAGMFPIVFFFIALVIGLGGGASVLIGQAWGARETAKVKAIAGTALLVGAAIGLVAAIGGAIFARPVLEALGTPAEVLEDAIAYMRVMMLTMPLLLVFILFTQLLRGVGDTVTPLLVLIVSTTVGLALTPALIRGWLGLPQLGVVAAAVAGFISFVVGIGFLAFRLGRGPHPLAIDRALLATIRVDRRLLAATLRIGIPTSVQMVTISLAELAILGLVNRHGAAATASYGAVNQIVNYVQFPALSIAIAASILGAQSIGAGRTDRLGPIVRTGIVLSLCLTGTLVLIGTLFARPLLGAFITDAATLVTAERLLHLMFWSSIPFGIQALLAGVMRASGTVVAPTAIAVGSILCVSMPAAWLLEARYGLDGVWMVYPVIFTTMLILQTAYFLLVWRHRPIRRLV